MDLVKSAHAPTMHDKSTQTIEAEFKDGYAEKSVDEKGIDG